MATFFNPNDSDQNLLHESIRDHDEIDNVVDLVEWEILDYYSQREGQQVATYDDFFTYEAGNDPNNEIKVRLVGYDQTTPSDSTVALKEQLKYTIADVVSWVLRNYDNTQGAQSITQGQRSISYRQVASDWRQWPDGWRRRLKNFDARIAAYGL